MIVPKEYLSLLLNEIGKSGDQISIMYPPIGILFKIKVGTECSVRPLSKRSYDSGRDMALGYGDNNSLLQREIPVFSELRDCLYASSILTSENLIELEEILAEGCSRNLLKGNMPLFVGYDNNSLRFWSNKVVDSMLFEIFQNGTQKVGFCLSSGVKKELRSSWDKKFKMRDIEKLNEPFAPKFLNQPPKDARKARLGAVEYKHITMLPSCEEIQDSDFGDFAIIDSYKKFQDEHDVDVFLISGDNNFISMAHESKMRALYLKMPKIQNDKLDAEWGNIVDLIYYTAIVFGYIELGDVKIYGIWTGKDGSHWDNYMLDIDMEHCGCSKNMMKDIRILGKFEGFA